MTLRYVQSASCSPSSRDDSYIYSIARAFAGSLAAITSADEVLLVSSADLSATAVSHFDGSPQSLTTLAIGNEGRSLYCGDSGGRVSCFDVRSGVKSASLDVGRGITALQCRGHALATGTELLHHQAVVSVWDLRHNSMRWTSPENNDDITAVAFHPTRDNLLLAGGDDGLVSLFDINIVEEDDSLIQAIQHGPIHKAGFLGPDKLYALSSDQNLAIHPLYAEERESEPAPVLFGDLRPTIPCEYVVDIMRTGPDFAVAAGSHSQSRIDIVNIREGSQLDLASKVILEGAHGEEIVRSIFIDDESSTIFTAGEDGQIKAFRPAAS